MPKSIDKKEINSTQDQLWGIPEKLTLEFAQNWVKQRVSARRFNHITGVAQVAKELAIKTGCNPFLAELAAWLHDAYKETNAKELLSLAEQVGLSIHPLERQWGHLLHGPVAAKMVGLELKLQNTEVLNAIAEHTLGALPMSNLSKVLFLADCLEDGRPQEYTDPIWEALNINDNPNLDKAIVTACDLNLNYIIQEGKPIHPRTVEVRNYYLMELSHQKD